MELDFKKKEIEVDSNFILANFNPLWSVFDK